MTPERGTAEGRVWNREAGTVPAVVLGTAFLEGAAVLVVEIAGARMLAPFYGASLIVWTSQVTATLLFLALGYLAGGWLSGRWRASHLPRLFMAAGLWLCLLPLIRSGLLNVTARTMGVALGSFVSACVLFAIPLLCLGAVSPVLIEHLNRSLHRAGGAAGQVFFVNTIGGLAGAWLTALVLIPNLSMRIALIACGVVLIALGGAWHLLLVSRRGIVPAAALAPALLLAAVAPEPLTTMTMGPMTAQVVYAEQSSLGLVQVLDMPAMNARTLVIDGVVQAGTQIEQGSCQFPFTEYLHVAGHGYHPTARSALLLGLGSGCLARELRARNVEVTAVELEPKVVEAARQWFGLPADVRVVVGDARSSLRHLDHRFDLILSDVFVGENTPWYLFTREGLAALRDRLAPGGRLVLNYVTTKSGSLGLERVETSLLDVFEDVKVHVEPESLGPAGLVNATLVAGARLAWTAERLPDGVFPGFRTAMDAMKTNVRPARRGDAVATDEWSDLDFADAGVRVAWRALVVGALDARLLAD